ncbi:response regulator [Spirosoma endbachense]|nr:response regulator [Spirosoma endbachense]
MIINNRDQQTHEQALADGADDFLAKPIVFAQLNEWKSTEGSSVKPSG